MSFIERILAAWKILIGKDLDRISLYPVELDRLSVTRVFQIDTRRDPHASSVRGKIPHDSDYFRNELRHSKRLLLNDLDHLVSVEERPGFGPFREFYVSIDFYKEKPQQGEQRVCNFGK